MNTQDILNTILIIGLIVTVTCIAFVSYFLVKALKSITDLTDSLQATTQSIKDKIQMKLLTAIPALIMGLISKILKRGR